MSDSIRNSVSLQTTVNTLMTVFSIVTLFVTPIFKRAQCFTGGGGEGSQTHFLKKKKNSVHLLGGQTNVGGRGVKATAHPPHGLATAHILG